MNKQKFIEKIQIQFPKSRIDSGINSILDNFNSNYFKKIFDIFDFKNIDNKIYRIEDIKLIYYLSEFQVYLVQILLNNQHLLNNHFKNDFRFYELFNESTCYFILMKLKLKLFTQLNPDKKIINKFNKYLGHIDKLFDLNINDYQDFFQKDLKYEKKKEILLSVYEKSLKKTRKNIFLLFWLIEEDIKFSIFDKYEDVKNYEKFRVVDKISDVFIKENITQENLIEIENLQNRFKVIDNYKLFKENIISLL
jgi:hypothetical protein